MALHIPEFSDKLLVSVGALLIVAGISAGVAAHASQPPKTQKAGPSIDMLAQNWSSLDGATTTSTGAHTLSIAATDPKIVKQDGSGGQTNPAINLYGTPLTINGGFAVTTHFTNTT